MDTIDREAVDNVCQLANASLHDYDARKALSRCLLGPIEATASASRRSVCRKGCAHCCHLRIEAFDFELDTIHAYFERTLSTEHQAQVRDAIIERYPIVKGLSDQQQREINVCCPFLIDSQCSIYPVRPMSCAGYHSCDAVLCQRSNDDPRDTSFGIPQDYDIGYIKMRQMALVQMALDVSFDDEHEIISGMYARLFDSASIPA